MKTKLLIQNSFQGDSGGPLSWYDLDRSRYEQIGIVSFGSTLGCESGAPHKQVSLKLSSTDLGSQASLESNWINLSYDSFNGIINSNNLTKVFFLILACFKSQMILLSCFGLLF